MFKSLSKNILIGAKLIKNNPQIIYTLALLIIIPLAFILSSQKFLNVATENQERFEKDRIGLMQDVFVEFAAQKMDDLVFLQERMDSLSNQNSTITEFRLISLYNGEPLIIASINPDEIGKIDEINKFLYVTAGLDTKNSFIFENFKNGFRHWNAVRAITDNNKNILGFIETGVSLAQIDKLTSKNIKDAYYLLIAIVLVIFLLIIRHARIIDYTVLYKKLQSIDSMKDDFISMASHELRTPLTVIRGYVDILLGRGNFSPEDKKLLTNIDLSTKQLNNLVEDILDVSRIQQGRMSFDFKEVDISEIIDEVVSSFQATASEKQLKLTYEVEKLPIISIDINRLKQVFINIIGNSIKYTESGGITINTDSKEGKLYIRISDTGIGISAEDQKRLFSKFFRVKSEKTREIIGTGLGLWITNQIILNMHGTLSVESIEGKGTDFVISFSLSGKNKDNS